MLFFSTLIYAEDNADSGSGGTGSAENDKGHYNKAEYMYKVSVYVGKSDTVTKDASLSQDYYRIGNKPLYVKPSSFTEPKSMFTSPKNKVDYLGGAGVSSESNITVIPDNPPPPPIVNGGSITSVKNYFGDTRTLMMFVEEIANKQKGVSPEALVESMTFSIDGKVGRYSAENILPLEVNGKFQNAVPWVIVYEPVIISYLKDKKTILGFTATEYAIAQKNKWFNFKGGTDGQYLSAMTHATLPNSIVLERSWFGFTPYPPLSNSKRWSDDRIIAGGGWGMRFLKANGTNSINNNTDYDYTYRVNTDVITSVRIFADRDITPDNRHASESDYANPKKNTATVTMKANGYTKATEVVIPQGGSQLVWIKWRTPSEPGEVVIDVSVNGNGGAKIDRTSREKTLIGRVVDLDENIPPDPKATDRNDLFKIPNLPKGADKKTAEWGVYDATWIPKWVWHPKLEWEEKLVKEWYTWVGRDCVDTDGDGKKDHCPGHRDYRWVDKGKYVDNGKSVDEGHWEYDYTTYRASLSGTMELVPDTKVPTANGDEMKSGYGVNVLVSTRHNSNAPSSHVTNAQNVVTYFPEFGYETYCRLLEQKGHGTFEFKENMYSTFNSRVHFTPLWYPDDIYEIYGEVIDLWTPAGMLRVNLSDDVIINGNAYQDWHIGPK